jgi:DNA replication protein DnaC
MDEDHHPRIKSLSIFGEWFVRSFSNNDRRRGTCAIVSGDPGTGKTHIARRIYKFAQSWNVFLADVFKRCPQPFWVDWSEIAEGDNEVFDNTLYELQRSQLVILDDLGSESDRFKNGIPTSRLRRVLTTLESSWVFATTNLSQAELLDSYDARIADRLRAFKWFEMRDVPSYRTKL